VELHQLWGRLGGTSEEIFWRELVSLMSAIENNEHERKNAQVETRF
jgi:hypothetical protein